MGIHLRKMFDWWWKRWENVEWHNGSVKHRAEVTFFLDLLDKVVCISDRFPLLTNILSTVDIKSLMQERLQRYGYGENKFRSSLQAGSMNDLMTINMNGPRMDDFEARRCAELWYFHTKGFMHIKSTCRQHMRCGCQKQGWEWTWLHGAGKCWKFWNIFFAWLLINSAGSQNFWQLVSSYIRQIPYITNQECVVLS